MTELTPFESKVLAIYIVHSLEGKMTRAEVTRLASQRYDMNRTYAGKVYDNLAQRGFVGLYNDVFDNIDGTLVL